MVFNNSKLFVKTMTMVISALLILASLVSFLYGETFFQHKIKQYFVLKPNSSRLEIWSNPPVILYRKFYFFHVQNPDEFLDGARPKLVERGPYVYREVLEKRNIEFLNKYQLKYNPFCTLYFEPLLSVGNESDIVTVLNVPFAGMIEKSLNFGYFFPIDFMFDYYETKLFVKRSIKDIVSGYYDPLMHLAKEIMPDKVTDDKFGLLLNKNATEMPAFLVQTGADNPDNVAKMISWNGKNKLDFWEKANELKGNDGSFSPPFLNRDYKMFTFNPELCRSYSMTYLRDSYTSGIFTYDFHIPSDLFSCSRMQKEGFGEENCLGNGVFNLSKCQNGVSSFISQPHFLNTDKKFVDAVIGLKPNEEKHDFIFHYEPLSGVPIEGNARLQINIFVFRNKNIDLVRKIEPTLFPFFWFDEKISIEKHARDKINDIKFVYMIIKVGPCILFLSGALTFLILYIQKIKNMIRKPISQEKVNLKKELSDSLMERVSFNSENNI